jgi:hypothetical protein
MLAAALRGRQHLRTPRVPDRAGICVSHQIAIGSASPHSKWELRHSHDRGVFFNALPT